MGITDFLRGLKVKYGPLTSDKRFIAGEVVLVVAVNLFRLIEPFGTLIIGWASLWLRGMTWRDVGLVNPKSWKKTLLISAVLTLAVLAFSVTISEIVFRLTGEVPDTSVFDIVKGNYYVLAFLVVGVISWAGFPEELAYRGYFFNRLTDLFGGGRLGLVMSAAASSVIFGWGHWYEGVNAVITTSLMALLFVTIYLFSKKNIWSMIIIHSAYDVIAILIYFFS
jgi:membrane protease YdiL (CAAX protease family)